MDENTSLTENPEEEPAETPAGEKIAGEHNVTISLPPVEGAKIEFPQPPTVEKIMVENSMALSVSAQQDAGIENSMVIAVAAGRDMTASQSMATIAAVGRDLKLVEGGAGVIQVGGDVLVENGTVGLLVAKSGVTLNNSKILMTTQQAVAMGAAFGAVYALLRVLLRGKKKSKED